MTDPFTGLVRRRIPRFASKEEMEAYTAANLKRMSGNTECAYIHARDEAEAAGQTDFNAPDLDAPYEILRGPESQRTNVAASLCGLGILIGSAMVIAFQCGLLEGSAT